MRSTPWLAVCLCVCSAGWAQPEPSEGLPAPGPPRQQTQQQQAQQAQQAQRDLALAGARLEQAAKHLEAYQDLAHVNSPDRVVARRRFEQSLGAAYAAVLKLPPGEDRSRLQVRAFRLALEASVLERRIAEWRWSTYSDEAKRGLAQVIEGTEVGTGVDGSVYRALRRSTDALVRLPNNPWARRAMEWVLGPRLQALLQAHEQELATTNDAKGYERVEGVPFLAGEAGQPAIHEGDVEQGAVGDCYLLASLSAVARTDPKRIEEMITPLGGGKYLVRLHTRRLGKTLPAFHVVDDRFPARWGSPVYATPVQERRVDGKRQRELWPLLIEKAWAKERGGYDNIRGGILREEHDEKTMREPFHMIGGRGSTLTFLKDVTPKEAYELLAAAERRGNPVMVGSHREQDVDAETVAAMKAAGVYANHAYTITGVKDGKVHLRNPWNSSHPKPMTAAVFQRVFARFSVGDF